MSAFLKLPQKYCVRLAPDASIITTSCVTEKAQAGSHPICQTLPAFLASQFVV